MADWIIGGVIAALVVFIIIRTVIRIKRGKGGCCSGCSGRNCGTGCKM